MVKELIKSKCTLAETPLWAKDQNALFWVDIDLGNVHAYFLNTQNHKTWNVGEVCAGLATTENADELLTITNEGIVLLDTNKSTQKVIIKAHWNELEMRPNEAKVDVHGNLWMAIMSKKGEKNGVLYCLENAKLVPKVDRVGTPNTLAWNKQGTLMYFGDSSLATIYKYPLQNQAINGEPTTFYKLGEEAGMVPDGSAIDSEGCLWTAHWGGGIVRRISPDAKILNEIKIPASQITSCCFGGKDMKTLFVTTAAWSVSDREPQAGNIFSIETNVVGQPIPNVKI